jgi:ferredoxin--NADP+ reductase
VSYADWAAIDAAEKHRGALLGKPREKFVSVAELLAAANA